MKRIKENSIQFEKLTFNKLIKAIFNMPVPQIVFLFGIMISLIGGSFALGKTFQENASNKEQYELKIERDNLKSRTLDLEMELVRLNSILTKGDSIK